MPQLTHDDALSILNLTQEYVINNCPIVCRKNLNIDGAVFNSTISVIDIEKFSGRDLLNLSKLDFRISQRILSWYVKGCRYLLAVNRQTDDYAACSSMTLLAPFTITVINGLVKQLDSKKPLDLPESDFDNHDLYVSIGNSRLAKQKTLLDHDDFLSDLAQNLKCSLSFDPSTRLDEFDSFIEFDSSSLNDFTSVIDYCRPK